MSDVERHGLARSGRFGAQAKERTLEVLVACGRRLVELGVPAARRRALSIAPGREPVLPASPVGLCAAFERVGAASSRVGMRGLRFGVLQALQARS